MNHRGNRRRRPLQCPDRSRVHQEIAAIEVRLAQLGPDGDCGYEKAMIRFYERQLVERRRLLELEA